MRRAVFCVVLSLLFLGSLTGIAYAAAPGGDDGFSLNPSDTTSTTPALSLTYAQIINGGSPVYANLADAAVGAASDWIKPGFVFVSLASAAPVSVNGRLFYALHQGGYVPASQVYLYPPSQFQGVQLDQTPDHPFGWVLADSAVSATPGAAPLPNAVHYARYARLSLLDSQNVNGVMWYRVGDSAWLSQYRFGIVSPSKRPDSIGPNDKWIEVNLYEQTLAAYEGDRMVYATLVASGLPKWETDPGLFKIYEKFRMDRMTGDEGKPDYYYLQDIPWIMYFDNDQALHTAYWHDGFGAPHSHGCVNLAPQDSMWLFNWSGPVAGPDNLTQATDQNPGTWVWVHY